VLVHEIASIRRIDGCSLKLQAVMRSGQGAPIVKQRTLHGPPEPTLGAHPIRPGDFSRMLDNESLIRTPATLHGCVGIGRLAEARVQTLTATVELESGSP